MESSSGAIKDKFLAGVGVALLLACYMVLAFYGLDTKFIEGGTLIMIGVFAGLLKQSPSPQQNINADTHEMNISSKP